MRVAALIIIQALVSLNVGAQAPYFPDVYLAPQFEAPVDAPSRVVVAGADEPGERLVVSGRVLDGGRPVGGVSIYVFQTDVEGLYSKVLTGNEAELDPRLHGFIRSDANGGYEYETIRPGHYDGNPAHVHYLVRAPGYYPSCWISGSTTIPSSSRGAKPAGRKFRHRFRRTRWRFAPSRVMPPASRTPRATSRWCVYPADRPHGLSGARHIDNLKQAVHTRCP
jgi:hypothetical protein